MKLTPEELAALPAKTKKNPDVVDLYLAHDFLTAYALHTDLRIRQDGAQAAIGAVKDWERHGELQFEFLRSQGLRQDDVLLEIGCGTGRLARKLVPWMDEGGYVGVDISRGAIAACKQLAVIEGWADRFPLFETEIPPRQTLCCSFAWAFSVFIHLPVEEMARTMRAVRECLARDGKFYFSFVPDERDERTGLKQFRHTLATYQRCAFHAGLTFVEVSRGPEGAWKGEQHIALAQRLP